MSFNWLGIKFNAGADGPPPETWGNQVAALGLKIRKSVLIIRVVLTVAATSGLPPVDGNRPTSPAGRFVPQAAD
jgi:hypothetical protein